MKSEAICQWCDEEFEYIDGSEWEQWTEDYDGNQISDFVVTCPNCQCSTKVY